MNTDTLTFGSTTYDSHPAVAAAAVSCFTHAYGDCVFADLPDDGDLADELLTDLPMAQSCGDLAAQGVSRETVAAAFTAARAVWAADAWKHERRVRR